MAFDADAAERYDQIRPDYPAELVQRGRRLAGLREGARVLEIGAGTCKLTRHLVGCGYDITAVEPSHEMFRIGRKHLDGAPVEFRVATFEDVDLPARSFDAIFSATAFHWLDPRVGWSKAASLLRPGGTLLLYSHIGGPFLDFEPDFYAEWRAALPSARHWQAMDPAALWSGAKQRIGNVSSLWEWLHPNCAISRPEAANLFTHVTLTHCQQAIDSSLPAVLNLLHTQSAFLRLDATSQARLENRVAKIVERDGGSVRAPLFAVLVTARANPDVAES